MTEYTHPTPLSVADFRERIHPMEGRPYTQEEAEHKVKELVFGAGFKTDADGKPVETGKGSALQPTAQHYEALAKEAERAAMAGRHLTPEAIGAAVAAAIPQNAGLTPDMIAAAVTAALAGRPATPARKKPGRKPATPKPEAA